MAKKTNPKALRLRRTEDWHSRGFYGKKPGEKLFQDFKIRKFLNSCLEKEHLEKIEIERFASSTRIIIFTSRPGLIIGRSGTRISQIKKDLEKNVSGLKNVKVDVQPVKNVWISARLVAEWMAGQIKNRVSYRRVLKQALSKVVRNKEVKGVRVQLSGRLNGLEMARTEWMKEGELKRQTLRGDLDYGTAEANCTYGVIGVKVWIYKGEKL